MLSAHITVILGSLEGLKSCLLCAWKIVTLLIYFIVSPFAKFKLVCDLFYFISLKGSPVAWGDSMGKEIWHGCIPLQRGFECSKFQPTTYFAGSKLDIKYNTCLFCLCFHFYVSMKYWQAVKEIYEIVPARDWKKEEKPMNKIVFIGNTGQTMFNSS